LSGFANQETTTNKRDLVPTLTLTSTIISTQQLHTGDIVSYAGKRKAPHPWWSFTLPFWYFEGLPRNLTNKRWCSHDLLRQPQVGTICMNLSSYRSDQQQLEIWTKVTLMWNNLTSSILHLASLSSTIPYEILTRLHPSIRRRIVE
jgi:alanine racemase